MFDLLENDRQVIFEKYHHRILDIISTVIIGERRDGSCLLKKTAIVKQNSSDISFMKDAWMHQLTLVLSTVFVRSQNQA